MYLDRSLNDLLLKVSIGTQTATVSLYLEFPFKNQELSKFR